MKVQLGNTFQPAPYNPAWLATVQGSPSLPTGMSQQTWSSLTPSQQLCATNPSCDFTSELISLLGQDQSGTGAGTLPDGASQVSNPTPTWVWIIGLGIAGLIAVEAMK